MVRGPSAFLYLSVDPSQGRVRERLTRLGAEVAPSLRQAAIALGEVRPEEVLAECRQLGIRVLASAVRASPPG